MRTSAKTLGVLWCCFMGVTGCTSSTDPSAANGNVSAGYDGYNDPTSAASEPQLEDPQSSSGEEPTYVDQSDLNCKQLSAFATVDGVFPLRGVRIFANFDNGSPPGEGPSTGKPVDDSGWAVFGISCDLPWTLSVETDSGDLLPILGANISEISETETQAFIWIDGCATYDGYYYPYPCQT